MEPSLLSRLTLASTALLCGVSCAFAGARLVLDGTIGQTVTNGGKPPVPWTSCAWVVTDAAGDVHFPDGFVVRRGTRDVACLESDVNGRVVSDGAGEIFCQVAGSDVVRRVDVSPTSFRLGAEFVRFGEDRAKAWAVSPDACRGGFAHEGRLFAWDGESRRVRAWNRTGDRLGTVLDLSAGTSAFTSIAVEPRSGDLLLGVGWPENRVRRYRCDGTEVVVPQLWPRSCAAPGLQVVGKDVWGLSGGATRIGDGRTASETRSFGVFAFQTQGIADGGNGLWLATTQGAQFYPSAVPERCTWRLGGLSGVSALAVLNGRVLACSGHRLINLWLDDRPTDILTSEDGWSIAKTWDEAVDGIDVRDGRFYLHESRHDRVIAFDPSVTDWQHRARRQFEAPDVKVKSDGRRVRLGREFVAKATAEGIELYRRVAKGKYVLEDRTREVASCLAAEGEWLVAYVPARQAICRYRLDML